MAEMRCPFCTAPYQEVEGKCFQCKAPFPWAVEAATVRDALKEREVNRGRATLTLIDEVFAQSKGGKPVSLAAIKGFAFAWLFPRTIIVIGSVITGLVLVAQTIIIWQQTALLKDQTLAAQFQQAEIIRARIPKVEETIERLAEAEARRQSAFLWTKVIPLTCSPDCERVVLSDVIGSPPSTERDAIKARDYLATSHTAVFHEWIRTADTRMPDGDVWPDPSPFGQLLEEAHTRCGTPRDEMRRAVQAFNLVASLHRPVFRPGEWQTKKPQLVVLPRVFAAGGKPKTIDEIILATVGEYRAAINKIRRDYREGMAAALARCQQQLQRDQRALLAIDRIISPEADAVPVVAARTGASPAAPNRTGSSPSSTAAVPVDPASSR